MARDGSSGGVVRLAIIEESGITREMIPDPALPKFWDEMGILKPTAGKTMMYSTISTKDADLTLSNTNNNNNNNVVM